MKKIISTLLIISLIFSFINVSASTNTKERLESENYGVNKKWKINNNNIENVKRTPYVDASEKIYDFADILTDSEETELLTLIRNYIELTNMDMVLLTAELPYSEDLEDYDNYAVDFYDYNDFGINFEKYNGVLLFRNANYNDPYFNIYTFGEAQLYYNFNRTEDVLDHIYPYFKSHNYLEGYKIFIEDFTRYYNEGIDKEDENYYVDDDGFIHEYRTFEPPLIFASIVALITSIIVISVLKSKNKMIVKATHAYDYLNKETINYTKKTNDLVSTHTSSYRINNNTGSGGSSFSGGRSSFRGSSGGGHSRGGGRRG